MRPVLRMNAFFTDLNIRTHFCTAPPDNCDLLVSLASFCHRSNIMPQPSLPTTTHSSDYEQLIMIETLQVVGKHEIAVREMSLMICIKCLRSVQNGYIKLEFKQFHSSRTTLGRVCFPT